MQAVKSYVKQREIPRLETKIVINHYRDFITLVLSHHKYIFRMADKSVEY